MTDGPETPGPLTALREDWDTALCVVAHPDDLEFGAAAAVARWTRQGKRVVYCLLTSGEAGIDTVPPEECGPLREAEQLAAARLVGVTEVEFLRLPDGVLEHGVDLRARIAHVVRRHRPEVVVTGNHHETWDGRTRNSADHVATGRAALDAVADAGNRWIHRDQLADGLEPWGGTGAVISFGSPYAGHAVDTSATFEAGVASLEAHRAYLTGLGWSASGARDLLEGVGRPVGRRLGVAHGAAFEVVPIAWVGV